MSKEVINKKIMYVTKLKNKQNAISSSMVCGEERIQYSIDPKLQMNKQDDIPLISEAHPINHLHTLENDLFGHIDVKDSLSTTRRRKILRRKERKLTKKLDLPQSVCSNNKSFEKPHCFNEFIKSSSLSVCSKNERNNHRTLHSKWDLKTSNNTTANEKICQSVISPLNNKSGVSNCKREPKGCRPQSLYTVKDNKIVKLEEKLCTKDGKMKYETCELKVPTNDAEKMLLEGTKLTLEEIKGMQRFHNYEPGEPSNVLYIKNLAKNVEECDLTKRLSPFDDNLKINLLKGKMRGQAFASFSYVGSATKALIDVNGTIIKGKPLVIEYSKSKAQL